MAAEDAAALMGMTRRQPWFYRQVVINMAKVIVPYIPSKTNRRIPIPHDLALYGQCHCIENMFGKL